MKQWIALLATLVLLLGLTACGKKPEASNPETPENLYDFVFDMNAYDRFSDIFLDKTPDEWDGMGCYTILLEGLCTPVTVQMDGRKVLSVCAYGYTEAVNIDVYQDESAADIRSTQNAVLVNEDLDYRGSTWILTADGCHGFQPEGDISTQIRVREDGTMRYRRYWGEYETTFHQDEYAPLYQCTGRDHFLYETGAAEIVDGIMTLTKEKTVVVSDEYDLDAMFAQAQAEGLFAEYDSVDDCLTANRVRG